MFNIAKLFGLNQSIVYSAIYKYMWHDFSWLESRIAELMLAYPHH